jgi:hypothetical protein
MHVQRRIRLALVAADHRIREEVDDIEPFVRAYLKQKVAGTLGQPWSADAD